MLSASGQYVTIAAFLKLILLVACMMQVVLCKQSVLTWQIISLLYGHCAARYRSNCMLSFKLDFSLTVCFYLPCLFQHSVSHAILHYIAQLFHTCVELHSLSRCFASATSQASCCVQQQLYIVNAHANSVANISKCWLGCLWHVQSG